MADVAAACSTLADSRRNGPTWPWSLDLAAKADDRRMIGRMISQPRWDLMIKARNLTIKARNYVKSAASAGRRQRLYALGSERKRIEKVSRASTGRIAKRKLPPGSQTADGTAAQRGDAPCQRGPTIRRENSTAVFSAAAFFTVRGTWPPAFPPSSTGERT